MLRTQCWGHNVENNVDVDVDVDFSLKGGQNESLRSSRSMIVSQLITGVRCVQKDKSLRVLSNSFFNNSIQFQQCLVRTDGRRDIATYWAVWGQLTIRARIAFGIIEDTFNESSIKLLSWFKAWLSYLNQKHGSTIFLQEDVLQIGNLYRSWSFEIYWWQEKTALCPVVRHKGKIWDLYSFKSCQISIEPDAMDIFHTKKTSLRIWDWKNKAGLPFNFYWPLQDPI